MLRSLITVCAVVGLFVLTGIAIAEEFKGSVVKVDAEKMTLTVKVGDKDTEFKCDKETKFVGGKDGSKDLKDGIKSLKDGAKVTVTAEKKGDALLASKVQVGKK